MRGSSGSAATANRCRHPLTALWAGGSATKSNGIVHTLPFWDEGWPSGLGEARDRERYIASTPAVAQPTALAQTLRLCGGSPNLFGAKPASEGPLAGSRLGDAGANVVIAQQLSTTIRRADAASAPGMRHRPRGLAGTNEANLLDDLTNFE